MVGKQCGGGCRDLSFQWKTAKAKGHCARDERTGDPGFTSTCFMPV